MSRQTIRPSKGVSKASFFIGILFTAFGVIMMLTVLVSPIPILTMPFFIVWTGIAVFNTYTAYKNAFTEEGMPTYEINHYADEDFDTKLRKIKALKDDGIISELEFEAKKKEIMNQKW